MQKKINSLFMEVMYLSNVAEYNIFAAGNSNWQLSSAIHHVIHVTLQANNHRTCLLLLLLFYYYHSAVTTKTTCIKQHPQLTAGGFLLQQSFTSCLPLLIATSTFG